MWKGLAFISLILVKSWVFMWESWLQDRAGNLANGAIANIVDIVAHSPIYVVGQPANVSVDISISYVSTAKVNVSNRSFCLKYYALLSQHLFLLVVIWCLVYGLHLDLIVSDMICLWSPNRASGDTFAKKHMAANICWCETAGWVRDHLKVVRTKRTLFCNTCVPEKQSNWGDHCGRSAFNVSFKSCSQALSLPSHFHRDTYIKELYMMEALGWE